MLHQIELTPGEGGRGKSRWGLTVHMAEPLREQEARPVSSKRHRTVRTVLEPRMRTLPPRHRPSHLSLE